MENVVQSSTDYEKFKLLDSNRDQSRGHIEAVKTAFEEIGNLTKVQPILVNDKFEIIDGQHRFTACKELGEPIYYTQVSGLTVSDARKMNTLHRNWSIADYAKSYAASGDGNYIRYEELREAFEFNHSVTMLYAMGFEEKGAFKRFRDGGFTLSSRQAQEGKARLDKLAEIAENFELAKSIPMSAALLRVEKVEGFDHKRLVDKFEKYGSSMLTRQAGIPEYMRVIEDIYNHNQGESTRLRLF